MTDYERYADELAAKYGIDPTDRYYEGDCVVADAASDEERWKLACLWERCHFDGEKEQ